LRGGVCLSNSYPPRRILPPTRQTCICHLPHAYVCINHIAHSYICFHAAPRSLHSSERNTSNTNTYHIQLTKHTLHLIYFHHAILIYHHRLHWPRSPRDSYLSRPSRLWNLSGRLRCGCHRLLYCRWSNLGSDSWSYGSSNDFRMQHCIRNLSSCLCCRASRTNPLSKGQLQPIR
jgi:hypothetical protein